MRLGTLGMFPTRLKDVDGYTVEQMRTFGFHGVGTSFSDLDEVRPEDIRRFRKLCADVDLDLVALSAWSWPVLDPNPEVRARNREMRASVTRAAAELGFRSVTFSSGSLRVMVQEETADPRAQLYPDPRNMTREADELFLEELQPTAQVAAEVGVRIGLEPHTYTVISDAPRARRLIDELGSEWVKVTMDIANWFTPREYLRSTEAIDEMFDVLADAVWDAHGKDVQLADSLAVHMPLTWAGNGGIDWATVLTRLGTFSPERYLMLEHTPSHSLPRAIDHLRRTAAAVGIELV